MDDVDYSPLLINILSKYKPEQFTPKCMKSVHELDHNTYHVYRCNLNTKRNPPVHEMINIFGYDIRENATAHIMHLRIIDEINHLLHQHCIERVEKDLSLTGNYRGYTLRENRIFMDSLTENDIYQIQFNTVNPILSIPEPEETEGGYETWMM